MKLLFFWRGLLFKNLKYTDYFRVFIFKKLTAIISLVWNRSLLAIFWKGMYAPAAMLFGIPLSNFQLVSTIFRLRRITKKKKNQNEEKKNRKNIVFSSKSFVFNFCIN
jgi:hypothetical protein